jgi:hypothetical protein
MKQILLTLGLLTVLALKAQKKEVKLYGFSQGVSKGIRKTTVDEKGLMTTEKKGESKTLLLYVEFPAGLKLNITELWINGEKYSFETTPVKTPVILNTGLKMPDQKETVLIPETRKEVERLIPLSKIDITEKDRRQIAKRKPVVVFYKVNGKNCKRTLDKLVALPEIVME